MSTSQNISKGFSGMQITALMQRVTGRVGVFRSLLPMLAFSLAFLLLPAGSTLLSSAASSGAVPVIKVIAVSRDNSVTIRTFNYPANQTFTATMGRMGTRGINGYVVGSVNSGAGGTFDVSFPIPAQLYGSYQISIRLQTAHANPYYSYNWFYNNTTGNTGGVPPSSPSPQPPVYTGIPTFRIVSVTKDTSVTIETNNYPPNQTFTVTMGQFGTRGINGIVVGTLDSGAGGTLTASYAIPNALKGMDRIAIRAQTAHANPYYSYNWFWNNDANTSSGGTGGVQPQTPAPRICESWRAWSLSAMARSRSLAASSYMALSQ